MFVFRLTPNDNEVYQDINKNIVKLFDKNSCHNILMGDLITFYSDPFSVISLMYNTLGLKMDKKWSADYFLLYINNISKLSIKKINDFFMYKDYYVGTCDLTFDSEFKAFISNVSVLTQYVKIANNIFNADADTSLTKCSDRNNGGWNWEKYGYKIYGVNDALFNTFLKYKIDTTQGTISSNDDKKINTIFMTSSGEESIPVNNIIMDSLKYDYLENEKQIFERIGISKDDFLNEINKKILNQSWYNIEHKKGYNKQTKKEYDVITFNIFLEFKNPNKNYFEKYTLGLTYDKKLKQVLVGTMY